MSVDAYDGAVGALAYTSRKLRDRTAKGLGGPGFLVGYAFGRYLVVLDDHARPETITAFVDAFKAQQKARVAFDAR